MANADPTVSLDDTPTSATEGVSISVSGSFDDLGVSDTVSVWIDWGDGSGLSGPQTGTPDGSFAFSDAYPDNGNFNYQIIARDDDNGAAFAAQRKR